MTAATTARGETPVVVLTIAGSDSGAGAGLQADLKTFAALGVYGTCAVTAVTAQHTAGVLGVSPVAPEMVDLQITAVLGDLPVAAVKTGMLATPATVAAVARRAAGGELVNLVVDPVLVASTGRILLDDGGPAAYVELLIPHARVVTPNLHEAALLTGTAITDVASMAEAGRRLLDLGPEVVVVKGGHLGGETSPDVLVSRATAGASTGPGPVVTVLDACRVPTGNDHGTGCTLSAAITAALAAGVEPGAAVRQAKDYVRGAIRGAAGWTLGAGRGPLDHFGWGPLPG